MRRTKGGDDLEAVLCLQGENLLENAVTVVANIDTIL